MTSTLGLLELRQYLLRPRRRDELVELFDRELARTQEPHGIVVAGQFTDLDRPDHFVWLRGFADPARRAEALAGFYTGPVWREHKDAANATMIDSDDVLLLRPLGEGTGLPWPPPARDDGDREGVTITVHHYDGPLTERDRAEVMARPGGELAVYETHPGPNDFPPLPVREGEHVVVRITRGDHVEPGATQVLRLAPTEGSHLR